MIFGSEFVKVGALKPAEAKAPATPSKEANKDLNQKISIAQNYPTMLGNSQTYFRRSFGFIIYKI